MYASLLPEFCNAESVVSQPAEPRASKAVAIQTNNRNLGAIPDILFPSPLGARLNQVTVRWSSPEKSGQDVRENLT
jgi:hypothetical protein